MPRERARRDHDDPERDPACLLDMLVAAEKIQRFVKGCSREEFMSSELRQSAVERQIEIIGEAARRLTPGFRAAHPEVPWASIMAQRHRIAHEYDDIDVQLVWMVATVHVPKLLGQVGPIIPPFPDDEEGG